ncbi:restriction endonuclease subunit S [Streptococcus salivarius]|uniref:restriction endonuclease subunit S n=1 Tax=Streptococcus salivarius TaxID=1304 RepID=UPI00019FC940|nr:restriction endonuclease subunit S [Streptococcus salivarius]EEK09234.1 type I restriction modification DNA specificity domain protein [Streptococcus salivarius SK126]QKH71263.1 restriction endonuclease subunit S [Streptococcus salivarius]
MKKQSPKIINKKLFSIWKKEKLKNIAPLRGGFAFKSEKFQNVGIPIVRISNIGFDGTVGGEFEYYSKLSPDEKFVLKGRSLLLAMSGATTGKIAMLDSEEEYYQNQRVGFFQNNGAVDYDFLSSVLQTKAFTNQLNAVLVAGAQPNISSKEIDSFEFCIPESIEEQSAIGSLFRILEDLLASYRDNLANYQSLKMTMLSKMFPKAGQTVPELRLDGFKGDWEVKELGNIVDFYTGLTYKPNDMVSDGTLVLRSSNVRDGEFIYKDNVFVNPDIVNCQNVKLGDIVVVVRNGSRDLIGKHALIKSEMPNTVIGAFMTGVRYDAPEFINALLDTEKFISEINKNLGSTINQITTGNFKRMKFHFPDKEEQRAIGSYFTNFDNLIVAHREKITQLETLKKKLLQDMFI